MSRVPRADWLVAGLKVLREQGDAALTVEKLCTALSRTKGAFYHHFADFEAFQAELLARWEHELTDRPISVAGQGKRAERGDRLDQAVANLDHELDRAVRAWGLRDDRVRVAVVRVDRRRISYLTKILREAGHPQAELRAQLEYVAFLGLQHADAIPSAKRKALQTAMRRALKPMAD